MRPFYMRYTPRYISHVDSIGFICLDAEAGTVQLPVPVTKWLATSIGGLVGRHLISNMARGLLLGALFDSGMVSCS